MAELARVEGLVHRFPDGGLGLDGAELRVDEGDFLILAGRNGSGKSLLARHLIGLARPSAGKVLCLGRPVAADPLAARRAIGLVFQDADAQIVGQTLLEDAAFGPANLGLPRAEIEARAREALALVGLGGLETRRPDSLSGGERRRLAIAGVLALRPACVLLDEPFANLDLPAIRSVLAVVTALHSGGRTIVVVTHELEKVLAHATRLAVMDSGRVVYDGPPGGLERGRYEELGLMDPFRSGAGLKELTWLR
ncbi:MAG: ABC transporter ATP-binding protein [Spirochaetaceae bacterium]|nr:ABC transporter ATP-binding protein [Spirochaetaceae bacterium]